ncbi:MAG TPA: ribosome recycling factor [Rhodospirillaceae bacterium]|nr:MAG: ribosome recycling factor [Alphaproteobacteria bacterium GWF2_58_20]HAU28484.1 ribosome recycling factor [Rhodospirillaceae bacterium]
MAEFDLNDLKRRMQKAVDVLHEEFSGLRTGRASASLLEPIVVDAYGSSMPLNQVGTISVPEPRLLTVQVWDRGLAKAVEKAIRDAGLGLNPQADGGLIRVPIPELSQERRLELGKIAGKYAEQARIAVRNIRREGMDTLKQLEKDHDISEDDHKKKSEDVQKITDEAVKQIDEGLVHKEKDIQQI